jgi:hypothetical protein
MRDESSEAHGFWARLSRRSKTIILIEVAVLAVVAAIGVIFLVPWQRDSDSRDGVASTPISAPTSTPTPPFETSYGLAWIVAACGGAMIIDDLPDSPLPRALDSAICVAPAAPSTLIAVYEDPSFLTRDVRDVPGEHQYAVHTDEIGLTWAFIVEGNDRQPLRALERYGFVIQ